MLLISYFHCYFYVFIIIIVIFFLGGGRGSDQEKDANLVAWNLLCWPRESWFGLGNLVAKNKFFLFKWF